MTKEKPNPEEPVGYSNDPRSRQEHAEVQDIWIEYSTNTINELAAQFKQHETEKKPPTAKKSFSWMFGSKDSAQGYDRKSFSALLMQLGIKRQEVEQAKLTALKDKGILPEEKFTSDEKHIWVPMSQIFGKPKFFPCGEKFYDSGSQVWTKQFPAVFAIVDVMLAKHQPSEFRKGNPKELHRVHPTHVYDTYKDPKGLFDIITARKNHETQDQRRTIQVYYPLKGDKKLPLSYICSEHDETRKTRKITVVYGSTEKEQVRKECETIAAGFLHEMLAVKHGDVDEFLKHAAKFCWIMEHALFFQRGSASITEWILHAAAQAKGISLGPFNPTPEVIPGVKEYYIGWDIKALLTPDPNEYADWFKKNAFAFPPRFIAPNEPFSFAGSQPNKTQLMQS